MIEVFKTNVYTKSIADFLKFKLNESGKAKEINFDLEDHDRVLRIEADYIDSNQIINQIQAHGFMCTIMPD